MSHPSIYFIMGEASEGYTVSSLNKKITFWKLHHHTCRLGRALPPPHLDKIQKNSYFFRKTFPKETALKDDGVLGRYISIRLRIL